MRTLFLFVLMSALGVWKPGAVEIIAHRGASYDAPENTLGSLRLGYQQGADAGEVDVHLTKDGKIAVLHDYDTARVASVSNLVAQTTSEELNRLEVGQWGKWKGSAFREGLPLLGEALAAVPPGKGIVIEIKCGPEILPELSRLLSESGLTAAQTMIICFDYETTRQAKQRFPERKLLWLAGADKEKRYPVLADLIAKAREAGIDGLNLEKGFPIDEAFVRQVHAAGLKLYVWTVDDPVLAQRLVAAGVHGITTNRPGWLREQLQP